MVIVVDAAVSSTVRTNSKNELWCSRGDCRVRRAAGCRRVVGCGIPGELQALVWRAGSSVVAHGGQLRIFRRRQSARVCWMPESRKLEALGGGLVLSGRDGAKSCELGEVG